MSDSSMWVEGIEGDFPLHSAVVEVMPKGTKVLSAESWGLSAWNKTAKISTILPDGSPQRYFLKCAAGKVAKDNLFGEHYSAVNIYSLVPDFCPKPVGKGEYYDETTSSVHYFFLQNYHDMDQHNPPDPAELASLIAELHRKGTSPTGMYGYDVPTGGGVLQHTITWEKSWAVQFSHQLRDTIAFDNEANGPWPEYDAACKQVLDHVIPRLLGALESDGREITPTLVHLDLWEGNVATDMETGKIITFDPGCCYCHNEIEFGTWRCCWATHFNSPIYIMHYQREIEPSEPVEEWDDRNRIYAIRAALCDSANHPGSKSRRIAYNDMLFLCEKYAPLDTLEKYDPEKDISVTGITEPYDVMVGARSV